MTDNTIQTFNTSTSISTKLETPVTYDQVTVNDLDFSNHIHNISVGCKTTIVEDTSVKKNGNPKTAVGSKKFALSVMSSAVTAEVALGMLEGALKYGRHNWRDEGARASTYWDAANRHLAKWWEGEDIDPDSGLSHLVKAIASLYVLRDAMIHENWEDDRPPALPEGWYNALDLVAADLQKRYPNPVEPHIQKGR